jgi:hypothetical protein
MYLSFLPLKCAILVQICFLSYILPLILTRDTCKVNDEIFTFTWIYNFAKPLYPTYWFFGVKFHMETKKSPLQQVQRLFLGKNGPLLPKYWIWGIKKLKPAYLYTRLFNMLPKYCMILKLFYFPLELTCSQIWLSPLVDGSRLTYLTNLKTIHWPLEHLHQCQVCDPTLEILDEVP